jgi:hypothetical protein
MMPNVLKKALQLLVGTDDAQSLLLKLPTNRPFKGMTERELIQLESEIGASLFGPVPAGNRREFFCLDQNTWIWHEEWIDTNSGRLQTMTTRYEIQARGILKAQDGAQYTYIEGEELKNLLLSIQMYYEQVARRVYGRDPASGKKLV